MKVFEAPIHVAELPATAGSYVLEFELTTPVRLRAGRLETDQ